MSMLHGLLLEFREPEPLVAAARTARERGYTRLEAYSPFPVEGLSEAVGFSRDRVAPLTLLGGVIGGVGGFLMQVYANVMDYPINVADRPDYSWPAFIPITFELTILCAALSAAFGMLALNRLPEPYHPLFNAPEFLRASRDRFFLFLPVGDPLFNPVESRSFLEDLGLRLGAGPVIDVEEDAHEAA